MSNSSSTPIGKRFNSKAQDRDSASLVRYEAVRQKLTNKIIWSILVELLLVNFLREGVFMKILGLWARFSIVGLLAVIVACGVQTNFVMAGIMATAGDSVLRSPPLSVQPEVLTDDQKMVVFMENTVTVDGIGLRVDFSGSGTVDAAEDLSPGVVPVGTPIRSYLFHFDPTTTIPFNLSNDPLSESIGSVTFGANILGVLVETLSLDTTDDLLGSDSTAYGKGLFRGIEGPGFQYSDSRVNDVVTIANDLRTLEFHFKSGPRVDQFRVITATPEPSSMVLVCTAFLLIAGGHRHWN